MSKLKKDNAPKILLFDIENAPIVTWSWGIHDDPSHSTKFVKSDWYIMCWSAKWLGEKDIISSALTDFKYNFRNPNDKQILEALWKLLDEADIVIAHNGKKFDCRKANTRFLIHGMKPPSPYKVIDTLTIARQSFMFTSNRLGDLGNYFGVGSKMETGGFELWKDCMDGDLKAWGKMVKYCKQDVRLLEKVYKKLAPYAKSNFGLQAFFDIHVCGSCGSPKIQYRGYAYAKTRKYRRFQCTKCGTWGRDNKMV